MHPRPESRSAIWVVCIAIGLLFLARGAFQPYAFPLFEHLGGLSYAQIALLLNGYMLAQSLGAPLAGWYADRTSIRTALATSIALGLASFLLVASAPGFLCCAIAIFAAGIAFVLGKIALNTVLVLHSSQETLRRSVAKRATLLNLGSFLGNTLALQVTTRVGYTAHAVLLGLLHLPLAIGLCVPPAPAPRAMAEPAVFTSMRVLFRNRAFLADSLRRFALVLPYGCWGTIIPKYVIDQYHSSEQVWVVYLTSVCTTVLGAHFLASYVSARVYRWGFRWESWSMVSLLLYCAGLLLLSFAGNPVVLPIAVVVFICGEVVMTPCFDETAKRHSGGPGMSTCLGLLHLVDGLGRMLGAAFSLAVYAWMREPEHAAMYWPVVTVAFLAVSSILHFVAHTMTQDAPVVAGAPSRSPDVVDTDPNAGPE